MNHKRFVPGLIDTMAIKKVESRDLSLKILIEVTEDNFELNDRILP